MCRLYLNALAIVLSCIQPGSTAIDCSNNNQITRRLIAIHNEKRALHNAPPLVYNATLEEHALHHAQVLAEAGRIYHAAGGEGENLWSSSGATKDKLPDPDKYATKGWYDGEKACYCGYETSYPWCVYGHFTQYVWAGTTQLGCGTCYNTAKKYMAVVCRYYPPGNVCGAYSKNVLPPYGNIERASKGILRCRLETRLLAILIVIFFTRDYSW